MVPDICIYGIAMCRPGTHFLQFCGNGTDIYTVMHLCLHLLTCVSGMFGRCASYLTQRKVHVLLHDIDVHLIDLI